MRAEDIGPASESLSRLFADAGCANYSNPPFSMPRSPLFTLRRRYGVFISLENALQRDSEANRHLPFQDR
jgi:hypothetical protein